MNAMSNPTLNNFNYFVLAYPTGEVPPGEERSSEFCQYEDAFFGFSEVAPQLGKQMQFEGVNWIVVEVQPYETNEYEHTKHFNIVVLTKDGEKAHRDNWHGEAPILFVPVTFQGDVATNEDGSHHFGICQEFQHLPAANVFDDWQAVSRQQFTPIGSIGVQGYRAVMLYWCDRQSSLASAT